MEDIYSIQINNIVWNFFNFCFKTKEKNSNKDMLHIHSYAELFFCVEGSIKLKVSNNIIILNKNDLCIIPSGINHTKIYDAQASGIWGCMEIFCTQNEGDVTNNKVLDSDVVTILYSDKICIFRNDMEFCSICQKVISNKNTDTSTLLELVCNFYKKSTMTLSEKIPISSQKHTTDIERLIFLDQIINAEYLNRLSNEEIASRLYISPRQLSRLVLTNYNAPLHKLLTKRRLEYAAKQLIETDFSIEAICHSSGFSNKTFFYQKFKKEFGITPVRYREEKRL